jgi:hypothetical protein
MTRAISAGLLVVVGRDGQPYDVRYNEPPPDGPNGPSAVVMERMG